MFSDWGFSWGGWLDNRRGEWWLLAQLLLITAHLLPVWPAPGQLRCGDLAQALVWAGSAAVGFGSVSGHRGVSLSRGQPLAVAGAQAVESVDRHWGSYAICRHPLYRAVLLCSAGVVLATGSPLHLLLLFSLAAGAAGQSPL